MVWEQMEKIFTIIRIRMRVYQKEKGFVSRMYMHLVVHGIFRHFFVNPQIEQRKWDLACDMATEYIIESWKLDFADISAGAR